VILRVHVEVECHRCGKRKKGKYNAGELRLPRGWMVARSIQRKKPVWEFYCRECWSKYPYALDWEE